ncbi:MAG: D-arabinono-1,4-lactone oxidase [Venatoribacter sp.]
MNFERIPLSRRNLLKYSAIGLVAGGAVSTTACSSNKAKEVGIVGPDGKRVLPWSNWSGNQSCQPNERWVPRSEEDLIKLIQEKNNNIRMLGSGHSFSGLVPTDQTLVSLARLRGIENLDKDKLEVDVWGGTRLSQLNEELWKNDLSIINCSDIDTQTWSGAMATSTHGTGRELQSISNHVQNTRLVTAGGDTIECSRDKDSDLFHALGCHIGALGVVTKARIKTEPAYYLKEYSWMMSEQEGLESCEELSKQHRHYEMYAIPHSDYILGITTDKVDKAEVPNEPPVESGDAYEAFRMMANLIDYMPFARRWLVNYGAGTVEPETRYGSSPEIFGNLRDIRFNEMEYTVPAEYGPQCLREILAKIKKDNIPVIFPIEARYVKADDLWLSQFYKRDGFSISLHNFHDKDYKKYFAAIEPIFWKYEGRPHWGKVHNLSALNFAGRYERFNDFLKIRKELDPQGRFINDHLRKTLGV